MPGEMIRRIVSTPSEKARSRELERARAQADVSVARVAGIADVSQTAMLGTLGLAMMKREAEMMVPDAAAHLETVMAWAVSGMAQQISRLAAQW